MLPAERLGGTKGRRVRQEADQERGPAAQALEQEEKSELRNAESRLPDFPQEPVQKALPLATAQAALAVSGDSLREGDFRVGEPAVQTGRRGSVSYRFAAGAGGLMMCTMGRYILT